MKKATLYRMVLDEHICPYGVKAKNLLEKQGFEVEDHTLTTRADVDAFKEKHSVDTTPQAFIDGKRIGGYDDLQEYFNAKPSDVSYKPVIALFSVTFLMALATGGAVIELFIAYSMCFLAALKLQDLESFSNNFLNYDLLARRFLPYSYVYPFAEAFAGIGMIAGLTYLAAPVALFIGTIGAISVFKAVYIDKRELKCACVGGNSKVPLGFISLTENLMMIGLALYKIFL